MTALKKPERTALEAVATAFAATLDDGGDPARAHITVSGKRVAVDITTLERRAGQGGAARPRLRFDKVATWVIARLQAAMGSGVPDGVTVMVSITAPIRLPSKTAAALEDRIRALLSHGSLDREEADTIHGNRVRILLSRDETGRGRAPKLVGFVHNADTEARQLFDLAQEVIELIAVASGARATASPGDRWLVAITARDSACSEVVRYIYSQLRTETVYSNIVLVFGDRRVTTWSPDDL